MKQAAVHAEAMAERHALHAQRVRETSERDIVEREKALAKGMHLASKRVHNITSSLSASFSEAVARLEVYNIFCMKCMFGIRAHFVI